VTDTHNGKDEPPKGGSRWTDSQTSRAAAKSDTIPGHREAVVDVISGAGDYGATWDEVCEAINQMYIEAGYDIRVRPGSISPRFREERKHGTIRLKREDGVVVTRVGDSGFEQDVYVLRKEDEPIDVVETDIGDYLDETKHGKDCLHCQLRATIRTFCATHPDSDYAEDIMAAVAAVIGDQLANEESSPFVSSDIRTVARWAKQRIRAVRKARGG
jgi:hypothetical protein